MNKRSYGNGSKFLRGRMWWVEYSRAGHAIRESSGTTDERKAGRFLRQRLEEIKKPEFVGPAEKKLTLTDLEKKIEADYIRHGRRSNENRQILLKGCQRAFFFDCLLQITPQRIEAFQQQQLDAGMARATVNSEIRYLLHGYRLLLDAREISYMPRVKLLGTRTCARDLPNGLNSTRWELLDADNQDIVKFLYLSAWRSGEAMSLEWSKIDLGDFCDPGYRAKRKDESAANPGPESASLGDHRTPTSESGSLLPVCLSSRGQADQIISPRVQISGNRPWALVRSKS